MLLIRCFLCSKFQFPPWRRVSQPLHSDARIINRLCDAVKLKKEKKRKDKTRQDKRQHVPLNIIGLFSSATPTYPVSSLSSLTAHSSGVSPGSIRPAGTSITT